MSPVRTDAPLAATGCGAWTGAAREPPWHALRPADRDLLRRTAENHARPGASAAASTWPGKVPRGPSTAEKKKDVFTPV